MQWKLEYQREASLPLLSWLASVQPGGIVTVRHGADVETRRNGFVEGVWDGDFNRFDFDQAEVLAGTGGRIRGDSFIFASTFYPLERLYVLRREGAVLVSNSLVFLLTAVGDGPDIRHTNYFFDLVRLVRRGVAPPIATLPTAAGRRVELYPCCNLAVSADLAVERRDKTVGPPPDSYGDYFRTLLDASQAVALNASDSSRMRSYPFVAACSRGYDSTATAALVSQAGCREGVTFSVSGRTSGHPITGTISDEVDDSGAEALSALGMRVSEYLRADFAKLPGHPAAEFFFSPSAGTDEAARLMERQLAGKVLVSGRHGERYWGPTSRCARRNLAEIDDCRLSGQTLSEYRLRAGFFHFPPVYVRAQRAPMIYRITHSDEMRPWMLGRGYYDRPIARRMAEEAGVPRECFGMIKHGGGGGQRGRTMSEESFADFNAFLRDSAPQDIVRRLDPRPPSVNRKKLVRLAYVRTNYAHWPLVGQALDLFQTDRYHSYWNSTVLYVFHWGFDKVRERYVRRG